MPAIHAAISEISKDAGALAPQKQGAGVPFAFRGVDQVVSHLAPHLKAHGVIVTPEVLETTHTSRDVLKPNGEPSGKVITQTELRTRFTFTAIEDGSSISAVTAGLAQDFADRSAAQAQSVAFRVALLQVFSLPTTDKEPEERSEEIIKGRAEIAAQPAGPRPSVTHAGPALTTLQQTVRALVAGEYTDRNGTVHDKVDPAQIEALGLKISGKKEGDNTWKKDAKILQAVIHEVTK